MKWGCLLVNLGTPDAPTTPAVRRYLDQFLMDRRVIDTSALVRFLVVKLAILPRRPKESAHAYAQVWTDEGSPLLLYGESLTELLQARLGDDVQVELGMRYGTPSLPEALARFRDAGVDRILVFPLYPQYATSSTGTAMAEVWRHASELWNAPVLANVPAFYDHPGFLDAFAGIARDAFASFSPDHVLFSFHGLPERQIRKSDESRAGAHCLTRDDCCDTPCAANRNCYRMQSVSTARSIAQRLGLDDDGWTLGFQSRLGRDPWIQPFTDELLVTLAKRGVKRLSVICPSFVADCLETLEEIGMRAEADFIEAGGEALQLVPSLNTDAAWVDAVEDIVRANVPPAWTA